MKKGFIIFIAIVLVALIAAPFSIGFILERYNQQMKASYSHDVGIIAEDTSYQRGWFHTQITTHITLQPHTAQAVTFTLQQNLRHGPILWGNHQPIALGFSDMQAEITFSNKEQGRIQTLLGAMPKIDLKGHMNYKGYSEVALDIPAFTHHNSEQDSDIVFHKLSLQASGDVNMKQSIGNFTWQGITITGANGSASLGQNTSHFHMTKTSNVWIGDMNWQTDKIEINSPDKHLSISNMVVTSQTDIDNQQRVSSQQNIHINSFTYHGQDYKDGNIQFTVRHIPVTSLGKLKQMQAQALAKQNQYATGMDMLALLPEIIAAEPIIEINDASLQTPDGKVEGSLHIAMRGLKKNDIFNFPKVKKHIEADIFVHFPATLVRESNQQIVNNYVEKGWLIQDGEILEGRLHMSDGNLSINEKNIPLPF